MTNLKRNLTILICLALSAGIFLLDTITPRGVADQILYTIVLLIAMGTRNRPTIITFAGLSAALTLIGFFISADSAAIAHAITNRGMAFFTIITTSWMSLHYIDTEDRKRMALEEKSKALAELKVLRGVLPICSSCKRIRDGKDSWSQLESYIRDHSEAEFTHGLCPQCVDKLYGEEFAENLPTRG